MAFGPMAYGIWPLAVDFWLSAKHIWGVPDHPSQDFGSARLFFSSAIGRQVIVLACQTGAQSRHKASEVAKVRPDVDHKAPSSEKSRKKAL